MARRKVKLAWIEKDSTRRATLKKRKKSLMKKVSELATLCNVNACAVIYEPQEPHPQAWPSVLEATRVLARFRSLPEMDQYRKMWNQEGYLHQRAAKLQEQLRRQERENRRLEAALLMHEVLAGRRSLRDVGTEDADRLAFAVDAKLRQVQETIEQLALRSSSVVAAGDAPQEDKTPMKMAMELLQRQYWLVDAMNPGENVVFGGGGAAVAGVEEDIDIPISYFEHNTNLLDPLLYFPCM